jgi:hypothetical protein
VGVLMLWCVGTLMTLMMLYDVGDLDDDCVDVLKTVLMIVLG